jgi:calcineurin-like phosphoesterase family protein
VSETGIIGDIHGHPGPLRSLLDRIDGLVNTMVFLGDYVDRGPDSAQVIDTLLEAADSHSCVFLEGNHDAAFRAALHGDLDRFLLVGGAATVRSYVSPPYRDVERALVHAVPEPHQAFLHQLRPRYETNDLLVGHRLPEADGTSRFRIGGHAPQLCSVPTIGDDYAYVDTGCGTLDQGMLTCLLWPSLSWRAVPV